MILNKGLIKHLLFLTGYITAFWGAFEFAYQSSSHPIFSGTWGFPIPHHYVIGFILIALSYFLFTKEDWIIRILEKFK